MSASVGGKVAEEVAATGAGEGAGAGAGAGAATAAAAGSEGVAWDSKYSARDVKELEWFRKFLQEKTVSGEPNYEGTRDLLLARAEELGLAAEVIELVPKNLIVLLKWEGSDPSLPSLVLNCHTDVVPAEADKWTVDPWAAVVKEGKIYGRGTQDMKSVGGQYMEAVSRLKATGFKPLRTIYMLFVPDEELSGTRGMQLLVKNAKFRDMNPGLVLDEGLASPDDQYTVFYGERKIWWMHVTATGNVGHGSRFIEDTATPKLIRVCNKVLEYREAQRQELAKGCSCGKALGDVCTVNLTGLKAGDFVAYNVIPSTAEAGFDCRIPVTTNLEEFTAQMDEWCSEEGVTWELTGGTSVGAKKHAVTPLDETEWWAAFQAGCKKAGVTLKQEVFPAATDSRFIRMENVPAFGFSPMINTPVLMHNHDEFIGVDTYLAGIGVYETLIPHLAGNKLPSEQ